jgi:hypothetical protein
MVGGGVYWCPKCRISFCGLCHIQLLIKQKGKIQNVLIWFVYGKPFEDHKIA